MAKKRAERWTSLFRSSQEPLFVLNKRQRLLFANAAWEALTGLPLADVRGLPCRRAPQPESGEPAQLVLAGLAPPAEVLAGQLASVRRRVALGARAAWWDIAFFPLRGESGFVGTLGKVSVVPVASAETELPLPETLVNVRHSFAQQFDLARLISEVPAMVRVKEQARLAAHNEVPLSIVGPPGVGKHWLARSIHQAGPGRDSAFVRLDCRRLSREMLTRLLFACDQPKRTVYLREPAHLPRELQGRLAEWLAGATSNGGRPRFMVGQTEGESEPVLPELACRLSTLTIRVPSLCERIGDLDGLVPILLAKAATALDRPQPVCDADAMQVLRNHAWPQNLRELYDVLLSACGRGEGERVGVGDLPFYLHQDRQPAERTLPLDSLLEQVEKRLIVLALSLSQDNKTKAAELLGIWRARLIRRMQTLGLNPE